MKPPPRYGTPIAGSAERSEPNRSTPDTRPPDIRAAPKQGKNVLLPGITRYTSNPPAALPFRIGCQHREPLNIEELRSASDGEPPPPRGSPSLFPPVWTFAPSLCVFPSMMGRGYPSNYFVRASAATRTFSHGKY